MIAIRFITDLMQSVHQHMEKFKVNRKSVSDSSEKYSYNNITLFTVKWLTKYGVILFCCLSISLLFFNGKVYVPAEDAKKKVFKIYIKPIR